MPMVAAAALSLALHAGLAAALAAGWLTLPGAGERRGEAGELDRERQPLRLTLGDPETDAVSVSWIGRAEALPLDAPRSEVDQPELTRSPLPPSPALLDGSPAGGEGRAEDGATGGPTADNADDAAAQAEGAERSASPLDAAARRAGVALNAAGAAGDEAWRAVTDAAGRARTIFEVLASLEADLPEAGGGEPTGPGRSAVAADGGEGEAASTSADESGAGDGRAADGRASEGDSPAVAERRSAEASGSPGIADEREADAAAIVPVEADQLGAPVETRGLKLITVRPKFSSFTRATVRPTPPRITIHFDHRGVATKVVLDRSSGSSDVDQPVINAAYRWRAEGAAIDALEAGSGERVEVALEILL
jgi:hypothetical protein